MPWRRCETCGVGFLQGRGRPARWCPKHRDGGGKYGGAHKKLVAAGKDRAYGGPCCRCGRVMLPGQAIHLDHLDGAGPGDYRGWSHARCNESAGARKGNVMRGRVNGTAGVPAPVEAQVARALAELEPVPDIRHGPGCACGGAVSYQPGEFWTSRCW